MSKRCPITGKGALTGNNVSHAHNKTRRRFEPNLQVVSLFSETLGDTVRMRMSGRGLRTIEHKGGLDRYLLSIADTKLDPDVRKVKRRIVKAMERQEAS